MANNKFVWEEGDINFLTEEEVNESVNRYNPDNEKPFYACFLNTGCPSCDEDDQKTGKLLAERIYESYFKGDADKVLLGKVLQCYVDLCKKLLPSTVILTKQLYCAARVQFLNMLLLNHKFTEAEIKEVLA